jgi:CRP/FNR family cyclic AMP-dependent transcriptional regulator
VAPCFINDGDLERLCTDPWFGALDADLRGQLLAAARPLSLEPGEFAFRQGDPDDGILGLVRGMLKASTLREDGKEAILAVLEPGNWFGEASCVDHEPRRHDVVAMVPCTLLHVGQGRLDELLRREGFAIALLRLESMHLRATYALVEDATLRSTRARVARRLRRLASGDAAPPGTAPRQAVTVTQENLAMMLGITRQTLALELKALAAGGAIAIRYGRIEIESLQRLNEFERDA